ncbi:MAG: hypothetical protein U9P00_02025 [Pseudomonadota bacterium]|nr:hypothetical protein [Pseudomonadota bacterium]
MKTIHHTVVVRTVKGVGVYNITPEIRVQLQCSQELDGPRERSINWQLWGKQ